MTTQEYFIEVRRDGRGEWSIVPGAFYRVDSFYDGDKMGKGAAEDALKRLREANPEDEFRLKFRG
ncbi:hypothetical protein [Nocardia arthritidis]|uniref:Uncharacterized protein n=1 Tax=Nocardia arthritidis TaxID=228602 RepID=A0A6G9YTZ1_9NOCA|nr:hypothetical protein [Nocardia arthritidis]QIS16476.1 hypothetical protein F5544_43345 [Nocardia arthritidis]